MADDIKADASTALTLKRTPDYSERYANNVRVESSVWDMRLVLGVLDQSTAPATVNIHSALNMPWQQAKLVAYFLQLHVLFHERANGSIKLPSGIMPPQLEPLFSGLANEPGGAEFLERILKLRAELE